MGKIKQSHSDLKLLLKENLEFLRSSAIAFDSGNLAEAKRMAVQIRVLLHDTKESKSLLTQLGWKQDLRYLDTAMNYNPKSFSSHHGLVGLLATPEKATYFAFLDDYPPTGRPNNYVSFPDWWNKVVISDQRKIQYDRRELIMALANKVGGAHVDPNLDHDYVELTKNNSIGWFYFNESEEAPILNIELFSVRQICFEIISTIERYLSKENIQI